MAGVSADSGGISAMHARHLALPAALLCVMFAACDDDDDPRSPGAGSPGVAGTSMTPPSLEGSWVVTSTPATSNCGPLNVIFENVAVLTIVQAGNDFDFSMKDDCGNPIPGGTGRVDPSGAVQFGTATTRPLTSSCMLDLTQEWAGLARTSADVINGSNLLTIAGSQLAGVDSCDPTLPCSVTGPFQAERCPRSGCSVTCTP